MKLFFFFRIQCLGGLSSVMDGLLACKQKHTPSISNMLYTFYILIVLCQVEQEDKIAVLPPFLWPRNTGHLVPRHVDCNLNCVRDLVNI
jgi:hypothetical protein